MCVRVLSGRESEKGRGGEGEGGPDLFASRLVFIARTHRLCIFVYN